MTPRNGLRNLRNHFQRRVLVYRLLFLMVVEERRLLFPPDAPNRDRQPLYTAHYGIGRLRDRAERYVAEDHYADLWLGLVQTFKLFNDDDAAHELGLAALGGELFNALACPDLEQANCDNAQLLTAIRHLSTFQDGAARRRVNYAALDVEELGSVYESLLEYQPHVELEPAPVFELVVGSERKQTGSYYTPPSLVAELVESALVPVLRDRFKGALTGEEREEAILGMRVCDTAMGSGHFLLAAARRMARELALVRSGEGEPTPELFRQAVRDVIRRCIYGVDKNRLAVDLCKVALWIEGYNSGLPLSFLDNHIRHGDALVGVLNLAVLSEGVPDDAYIPVTGDDKKTASSLKKRNRSERHGQTSFVGRMVDVSAGLSRDRVGEFTALALQDEQLVRDEQAKSVHYGALRGRDTAWWTLKEACDLWTTAFFAPLVPAAGGTLDLVPTTETVRAYLAQPSATYQPLLAQAMGISAELPFFHWPLEFPDIFGQGAPGGFDVVLGNPPWERIKLQEGEFFAGRDPEIAHAPNKAARQRLIDTLLQRKPGLAAEFAWAKHTAEAQSRFVRGSGRFPLCGRGDVNTYSIFAETMRTLINDVGRSGVIVPTGIAADDTTKAFFQDIVDSRALTSLYDFENKGVFFPSVHSSYKFCLLTLTGPKRPAEKGAEFAFFAHATDDLRDEERHFRLTADDIALLNPNTHTCPIFRGKRDAELTKAIYRRSTVLINESTGENPWGVSFLRMFDMSNDSGLFRTREQLSADSLCLEGNAFSREGEDASYLPLYEAKLLHQFDHRWATYDGLDVRDMTDAEKADPTWAAMSRYWVPKQEVEQRLCDKDWSKGWLLAFRDIARSTDERTAIFSLLPRVGVGNNAPLVVLRSDIDTSLVAGLLSNLSSFAFDFVARQKVGGTHMNFFIVNQLPILPPSAYAPASTVGEYIAPRMLELVYTAQDTAPFARDMGYDGEPFRWDPEHRFRLRCDLDALFFHLYGIDRDDAAYIMDTFPITARNDVNRYGEYRTKRVILEIYDELTSKGL